MPADESAYDWSLAEFAGIGREAVRLALGRHGDRYYHIQYSYPAEFGDGFAPRAALILSEWRWADTGGSLLEK